MPKPLDLTGQKFNKLNVLRFYEKRGHCYYWLCKCDCGSNREVIVWTHNLKRNQVKSCGCALSDKNNEWQDQIEKEYIGQQFHEIKVISFLKKAKGIRYWNCECVCGVKLILKTEKLKSYKYCINCKKSHRENSKKNNLINKALKIKELKKSKQPRQPKPYSRYADYEIDYNQDNLINTIVNKREIIQFENKTKYNKFYKTQCIECGYEKSISLAQLTNKECANCRKLKRQKDFYIGRIFGDFKVIKNSLKADRWRCTCTKCGKARELGKISLKNKVKCICHQNLKRLRLVEKNKDEMLNKKFTRLTVVEYVGQNKYGANLWRCQCDCGNITDVIQVSLKRGTAKSCGCMKREMHEKNKKSDGLARIIIRDYQNAARDSKREFKLSLEDCKSLFEQDCYYCGTPPLQEKKYSPCRQIAEETRKEVFLFNGIDRIDNSKGYTKENVRTSCRKCNIMKAKLSENEFYGWITKLIQHQISPTKLPIEKDLVITKEEKWKNHTEIRGEMYRQRMLKPGHGVYNKILDEYKRKAKQRKIDFNLSKEEFCSFLIGYCEYCGVEPMRHIDLGIGSPFTVWVNGVDRKDNTIGYTTENSATACHNCNHAKNAYSVAEFLSHIQKIYDNLVKNEIIIKD